ncbi:MAG: hypothetical protein KAS32_13330 [Candidatus Peribacteraceae bacterium]|nr:hypothetical protein [Candidatus Peribacteraceae bacterium]
MDNKYITNKEILGFVDEWHERGGKHKDMPDGLANAFILIAENLSMKHNFIGYTWREDMVLEAVFTCVKYFHSFDPEKSKNPWGYISRICHNSFIGTIKKQKKHGKIKQDLYDNKDDVDHEIFVAYKSIDYTDLLTKTEE